jgi:adenylosuccinate lyase
MDHSRYQSPFSARYATREMQAVFSDDFKFRTWRRLWLALARAEQRQGLPITDAQLAELESHLSDVNYADAEAREKECRHDVMAHLHAYGLQCPSARGILHWGATSCYVGDNTDILQMRTALDIVHGKLLGVIARLADFAERYKSLPALAYTHLQPAQLTTVGKRATLWLNDFVLDLAEVARRRDSLALLGSKGTTGTQASFLELFGGDTARIDAMEADIAREMGFDKVVPVSGQTYTRKTDYLVLTSLSSLAQSAAKFAYDMRLLAANKEMEEPFEAKQVGSSAMPYKRNPMRSERIDALARFLCCDVLNAAWTASTQMFERTLDDSANRRLAVAEAFLAADGILNILLNVTAGLVVYPQVIRKRVMAELPFMATENVLMDAVARGGDRQALHEKLRVHAQAAAKRVKEEGAENDLLDRIASDPAFGVDRKRLAAVLAPENYTGRAAEQTEKYLAETVRPLLAANPATADSADLAV